MKREITPGQSHKNASKLVMELFKGQGTRYELAARTGLCRNYVSRMLVALRDEGCAYIIDWKRDELGRHQQAIFTLGFGEDAERPPIQTQRERDAKRYRKFKERKAMEHSKPIKTNIVGSGLWV